MQGNCRPFCTIYSLEWVIIWKWTLSYLLFLVRYATNEENASTWTRERTQRWSEPTSSETPSSPTTNAGTGSARKSTTWNASGAAIPSEKWKILESTVNHDWMCCSFSERSKRERRTRCSSSASGSSWGIAGEGAPPTILRSTKAALRVSPGNVVFNRVS